MADRETRPTTVWSRPERGARGPAPERSRTQITAAALALADAEGLAAVSMRALAQRLGTGPASLYRYVGSRDELLDLMADAVAGELDLSGATGGDWLDDLVGLALQSRDAHVRHPWLADLNDRRGEVLGPHAIDYLDHALGILVPAPGTAGQKLEAIGLLGGLAVLFARREAAATATGDPAARAAHLAAVAAARAAHLAAVAAEGRHPHLLAALTAAGAPPPADRDALFVRLLRRLLPAMLGQGEP
ncbi:TetR/AcrR family transcriptional regulator [Streptomyces anulatus]|uniref:TetR/AcrR family transcriptional regulator n=1 Tax=Streptomyces anulatus TaxID=1892 RepID=UPI002259C553|nr:helix-turn-helix domain-containing protein [Streptomyces anulatus]MCX4520819.1 TetR/AcrR family transcriptional regulator [Streptomyces anulatus]MCX4603689.1 TetR/AcrR family transcriptional regulator [Streptomyces anulatus]